MSFPPHLIDQLQRGRVVPFVGSGVSMSVQVDGKPLFPSWGELLLEMSAELSRAGNDDDAGIVRGHCHKRRWFKAAEAALEGLNKSGFHDVLRKRFDIPQPTIADWSVPDALWRLRPPIVLTTNYDSVLQWRQPDSRMLLNDQPNELARLYHDPDPRRPTVWHLHGHISRVASLILAPAQYSAFYADAEQTRKEYAAATIQLQHLLANWTLLFVGFGMQDEYVMELVKEVLTAFGGATRNHFALMKHGEGDAAKLWKDYNVQVIEYPDHGAPLVSLLDQLAQPTPSGPASASRTGSAPPRPIVPPAYTAWLAKKSSQDVELSGLRPKHGQAVTLHNVYVPVVTRGGDWEPEPVSEPEPGKKRKKSKKAKPAATPEAPDAKGPEFQLLQTLIADRSLYLSGAPGSGKTTFCRWLTLAVCLGELPAHPIAAPKGFEEAFPEPLRGRLPLLIRLRDFWLSLPARAGVDLTRAELEQSLQNWIELKKYEGLTWSVVKDHLDAGVALLIFDGVDEVPLTGADSEQPGQPRQLLLSGLAEGVAHWTKLGNRVLVTSRPYGLSDLERQRLGLPHAPVSELPDELQRLLVRRWFHCLRPDSAEADAASDELWNDVAPRLEIAELAANPLLLTAMCIVYGENRKLPQDEFDLYDRIVDTVLCNRYTDKTRPAAAARGSLCVIAHGMHTGEGLGEQRDQPQAEATVDEIDRMLRHYQQHQPGTELHKLSAHDTREELLSQSGLLLPRETGRRAGFYHFTFQDFLAAERLYDLHVDHLPSIFRTRGATPEWRKALGLLFGALLHKRATPDAAVQLLTELIDGLPETDVRLGVVLADCWRVLQGHGQTLNPATQQKFVDFCLSAVQRETPLRERRELGLVLACLGDPRVVTDLREPGTAAWVKVSVGDYRFGDAGDGEETFSVTTPFELSRFPVTNGQFALFIAEQGYQNEDFWEPDGWLWRVKYDVTHPEYWRAKKRNAATQPVVGVSWWEADAFCRWAGCRLPTEREWEAAARGEVGRVYPWGNEWKEGICNSYEARLGATTPVGIFPLSVSQCGAHDMAGNVWEWCQDWYSEEQRYRVLRGGSWDFNSRYCRSAIRSSNAHDDRDSSIGFRVVCCSRTS